jgi:hypothetical protein
MQKKSETRVRNQTNPSFGIMQPYFLPYAGYFSLIKHTDKWIVFDDIQFEKQSWGNRNRILKHPEGLTYINVPLKKHKRSTLYSQIEIQNKVDWKSKIIGQFEYYKINAPYYAHVINLMERIVLPTFKYLTDFNIHSMEMICDYLDISFNYEKYSDLNLNVKDKVRYRGDWAFQICNNLGAKEYINPCMGHPLFCKKDWDDAGIKLKFLANNIPKYSQKRNIFEERLSIIDVLMWNSIEEAHKNLDSLKICNGECLYKTTREKVCEYETIL